MSYTIEHGKRVLSLKTGDKRFPTYYDEHLFFLIAASSNNISPREYDWQIIAEGSFSDWGGEIQLPSRIWQMGADADGGGIKPWNKDVSGLSYVKSWKAAVAKRQSITGWRPRVSLWAGLYGDGASEVARKINDGGSELFGKHDAADLYAAFKRLFPNPLRGGNEYAGVNSDEDLIDALYLYSHKSQLPFSFYVVDGEHSRFFAKERAAVLA